MLRGVISVDPGYAGGKIQNPTYEEVSSGVTGHAEVIKIDYDPAQIGYRDLLTVFFASHDPTSLDRQGNDVGTHYRSAVFYADSRQKEAAEGFIKELQASVPSGQPIVTGLEPLVRFYPAENYHRDYYARNSSQPYCQVIIEPKLQKAQRDFAELLRKRQA